MSRLVEPVLTTTIPTVTHVNETQKMELECTFLGNPKPSTITWKHNGVSILAGGDVTITQTTLYDSEFSSSVTSTLSVVNIGKTAGNEYECSTSNVKGTTVGAYNVSVCRKFSSTFASIKFHLFLFIWSIRVNLPCRCKTSGTVMSPCSVVIDSKSTESSS